MCFDFQLLKSLIMKFFLPIILCCVFACQPSKHKSKNQTTTSITSSEELPVTDVNIETYETLIVTDIQHGKDGYTAHLKDSNNGLYICTISIPNLGDQYKDLKIGDRVKIAGNYAESHPVQIFPKRILILN